LSELRKIELGLENRATVDFRAGLQRLQSRSGAELDPGVLEQED
jgi:hypothetical protein